MSRHLSINRRQFLKAVMVSGVAAATLKIGGTHTAYAQGGVPFNLLKRRVTNADRKAAAAHMRAAKAAAQASKTEMRAAALVMDPGGTPDYFGATPNWALSPLPRRPVTYIQLVDGGTGYSAGTTVTIADVSGPGAGATATATVVSGVITGISLTANGTDYAAPIVTITDPANTGSGAMAIATIAPLGPINHISLVNGGSGYSANPAITITDAVGPGTGASATLSVLAGVITGITLQNGGANYISPVVTITDPTGKGVIASASITGALISGGIRKFVDKLPGLGSGNANGLGQYIPVAKPDTITYPGSDYYEIELREYTEQMHSDLQPTTLRGYVQVNYGTDSVTHLNSISPDPIHYAGPLIIAQKNRPVRVKFTNKLPTGAGGNLFIPVDHTAMGAGMGPLGMVAGDYKENRANVHLHGGNSPWISDGTPHQWTVPGGEITSYSRGDSVQFVPDMWFNPITHQTVPAGVPGATNDPGPGSLTFYWTNQQSSRLLFFHDHSYGITRLNVYAGEAAGYLITDPQEDADLGSAVPADMIPLIIQDRTFMPDLDQIVRQDPTWPFALDNAKSNFWFPHVYMPNQNPYNPDLSGANACGRWDYGPWFWPIFDQIAHGPVQNPLYPSVPGEPPVNPGIPNPSMVPEGFMDTPVINGTAYPVLNVDPKAYRFRILNACNDRMLNLQLYKAASSLAMWNPDKSLNDANAGEVPMVGAVPNAGLPATWPTDGRDGGVPNPMAVGPKWYQIGTESGLLPAVAVLENMPVGFDYDRRSITVLNVTNTTLFMGPAERADVVIDFSQYAGQTLILYNDAPAPVPAFDTRLDYYTGAPDQTDAGGSPPTLPGYGPNMRTIMQIKVSATVPAPAFDLAALQAALPVAYANAQPRPVVPQARYNTAFNANYPADGFARIADTSMTFNNGTVAAINVLTSGVGYTSAPTVTITGNGTGAMAQASITGGNVSAINLTAKGTGYTSTPNVTLTGGGGSGARATAAITRVVNSITVTNGGRGYSSAPTVNITGGGGSGARATATVIGGAVTAITVTNKGTGYTSAPTVSFSGGGGSGARATAVLTGIVNSITLTNVGTGYSSAPTVGFTGGGGSGATAVAVVQPVALGAITVTNPGSGYTSAPTVTLTGGGATTQGTAQATLAPVTMDLQPKTIQELFTLDYGRMNATLGVELKFTNSTIQTTIPYGFVDPPTEILVKTDPATPIGAPGDGTQIWKITHNGVDTHAIHFHLFDVQVINRVGWDGMIKPPADNEIGWKDTVRMNPLEDCIVAFRPIGQNNLPWDLPNSEHAMDVMMPLGTTTQFTNVDPTNNPATVTNSKINYGFEYVWHCHLLGHEENDMMRSMILAVAPQAPSNLAAVLAGGVTLTWKDNSLNETGFTVQRASTPTGPWSTIATVPAAAGKGNTVTYVDSSVSKKSTYSYRVIANNVVGYTQAYVAPVQGYPNMSMDSAPSNVVSITTGAKLNAFIMANGFETGLAGWAGAVGNVQAIPQAVLGPGGGALGMAATIGTAPALLHASDVVEPAAYVYDDTPSDEDAYDASFYFDPNGASSGSDEITIFIGVDQLSQPIFGVEFEGNGADPGAISGWVMVDGEQISTKLYEISEAPHKIEVAWESGAVGGFSLYIDDKLCETLKGNTSASLLDEVLLGPSSVPSSGASGTMYFDQFVSNRLDAVQHVYFFPSIFG